MIRVTVEICEGSLCTGHGSALRRSSGRRRLQGREAQPRSISAIGRRYKSALWGMMPNQPTRVFGAPS
jgi:hypothetical protein